MDGNRPTAPRTYQVPYAQRKDVEEMVAKMLRMGVIKPSDSDFASPVVLVRKPDGSFRFCVDFRNVNEVTIKGNFPMPLIQEKLDNLSGCKFFMVLDLTDRMAFGLCNAGATFQRAMDKILNGIKKASA